MNAHNNMILPMRGEVLHVHYASNGVGVFAIVTEAVWDWRYMMIYSWEDGWVFEEEFRMGVLDVLPGNLVAIRGIVVGIGASVSLMELSLLVVEVGADSIWYILYTAVEDGIWEIEDILFEALEDDAEVVTDEE